MARFFTSDHHFGHKKIIEYCNRPFADLEEMRTVLVRNWNATVGDDDDVFIVGDFCFGGSKFITAVNAELNGRKHLIRGNHDWQNVKPRRFDLGFASITDGHQDFWLHHPPLRSAQHVLVGHFPYKDAHPTDLRYEELKPEDKGKVLLHGHVHQAWKWKDRMINVGVDVWGFRPVPEAELFVMANFLLNPFLSPSSSP